MIAVNYCRLICRIKIIVWDICMCEYKSWLEVLFINALIRVVLLLGISFKIASVSNGRYICQRINTLWWNRSLTTGFIIRINCKLTRLPFVYASIIDTDTIYILYIATRIKSCIQAWSWVHSICDGGPVSHTPYVTVDKPCMWLWPQSLNRNVLPIRPQSGDRAW